MKKLNELADEQLVSLYTEGNDSAFDALLKRYESKVFSYILYSVNFLVRKHLPCEPIHESYDGSFLDY